MIKKCLKCGAMVEVIDDCKCDNCGIRCCGEPMETMIPNSIECAVEKHLPIYERVGEYIVVTVPHVMDDEHYIRFISLSSEKINAKKIFKSGETPKAVFPYVKGSVISALCNKHGIWNITIE